MAMDYSRPYTGKFDTNNDNLTASWTVLSGSNISDNALDLNGKSLSAITIPAAYAEGNISFQASSTKDGTYTDVYDANGSVVSVVAAGASRTISFTGSVLQALSSLRYVKVKTTSNAAADRQIGLIAKR